MPEVIALTPGDDLWQATADYARACSWRAGPLLADRMDRRDFLPWERVFVAVEGDALCGYCTLTATDCLPDVTYTPYASSVFVGEPHRGHRLSQRLVGAALGHARSLGYTTVYLVSGEQGLYEKYGFHKLEERMAPWGQMQQVFAIKL